MYNMYNLDNESTGTLHTTYNIINPSLGLAIIYINQLLPAPTNGIETR